MGALKADVLGQERESPDACARLRGQPWLWISEASLFSATTLAATSAATSNPGQHDQRDQDGRMRWWERCRRARSPEAPDVDGLRAGCAGDPSAACAVTSARGSPAYPSVATDLVT